MELNIGGTASLPSFARPQERATQWAVVAAVSERLVAGAMLLALLPILCVIAAITACLSGQFPFLLHERVGRHGRTIRVMKLKTMWPGGNLGGAPAGQEFARKTQSEGQPKLCQDPRVTSRFAQVCRECSVDELPQLWNVLCGDMSLVGPRPLTDYELSAFYGNDAAEVLSVRPGMTGLWQVRGRSRLSYSKRRKLDLFLVRHWSGKLYLAILLSTVKRVIRRVDAW